MSGFPDPVHPFLRAFFHRLQELGWEEGKNLLIERRSAEGHFERRPAIFEELVRSDVDLILTAGTSAGRDALKATRSIPIVMAAMADPVETGLAQSLAHPGGNLTGFSGYADKFGLLEGKKLQQLTEMVPGIRRVAVLTWPAQMNPIPPITPEFEKAAQKLGVQLIPVTVANLEGLAEALATIERIRPDGLYLPDGSIAFAARQQIAEFALAQRLPSMGGWIEQVEAGLLMAYGSDDKVLWRGAAEYVDKILKGKKPADLPIQQPMRFEFTVNRKTAQALGIEIPGIILIQATRVIE